jgi:hypothetical protein
MTSEVAILNQEAVALAADSAVTVDTGGSPKVFITNKIFALSKLHPVGVMVYSNAQFMSTPWETIIKEYRAGAAGRSFPTLLGHCTDFLRYLERHHSFSQPAEQRAFVYRRSLVILHEIKVDVLNACETLFYGAGSVTKATSVDVAREVIVSTLSTLRNRMASRGIRQARAASVLRTYRQSIANAIGVVFEKFPLSRAMRAALLRICAMAVFVADIDYSGLVFAGFGRIDMYPQLFEYEMHGIANGRLIAHPRRDCTDASACIMPFAQHEMVASFMEGVEPDYQLAVEDSLEKILNKYTGIVLDHVPGLSQAARKTAEAALHKTSAQRAALVEYIGGLDAFSKTNYSQPIVDVVDFLPKQELATMAEALVALQSLKRRISMEAETVGGPIDVALISKGDGLIWVKRKHYFDPALNQAFMTNYMRR